MTLFLKRLSCYEHHKTKDVQNKNKKNKTKKRRDAIRPSGKNKNFSCVGRYLVGTDQPPTSLPDDLSHIDLSCEKPPYKELYLETSHCFAIRTRGSTLCATITSEHGSATGFTLGNSSGTHLCSPRKPVGEGMFSHHSKALK